MSARPTPKPSIDISSYEGTIWVYEPQARKRHGNPNRIKTSGAPRMSWAAMIKQARRES